MQKSDITAKRLLSLAPEDWVRWATDIDDAADCEILSGDFQLAGRESDTLILVNQSALGKFIALFELQTRYSPEMPLRMKLYTAFAEEKYGLPVLPILINILPYGKPIPTSYQTNFFGLQSKQDYVVINLWEVSAEDVLAQNLSAIIPFVPTMKGGADENLLQRAQAKLQLDQKVRESGKLGDLEMALSLFTESIFGLGASKRILRWTMLDIILESPLYKEIVQQGREQGIEQGLQEGLQQGLQQGRREELNRVLIRQIARRFDKSDLPIGERINDLSFEQAENLTEAIFDFKDFEDFEAWLAKAEAETKQKIN